MSNDEDSYYCWKMRNPTPSTTERGREVEDRAVHFFEVERSERKREKWVLLARNYRFLRGEIDLIWEVDDGKPFKILVFVEVRSRLEGKRNRSSGVASVDWRKRRHIFRAARGFLLKYKGPAQRVRFDILAWNGWVWDYRPNAFYPEDRDRLS